MNTNIRKYISAVLLGAASLTMTSCGEEFLDRNKLGEETTDVYFNGEEKAIASVSAAYSDLKDYRWGWFYWAFGETLSDNAIYGGSDGDNSGFDAAKNFTITADNYRVRYKWQLNYRGISKASQAIDGISEMDPALFSSPELQKRLVAEARFMRAYYHFDLVRAFGRIPIVDHTIASASEKIGQSDVAEVYAFIIDELEAAEKDLVAKSAMDASDLGRVTKGSAQGMLAKVHLNAGNYADAKTWAKKLMDSGEYQLDPDYAHIFSFDGEHGMESVFELSFINSSETGSAFRNNGNFSTLFMLPRNITYGYGINLPTQDLADAYDAEGDVMRKDVTLLETNEVFDIELAEEIAALAAAQESGDAQAIHDADSVLNAGKASLTFDRTGYYQGKMYVRPEDRSAEIRNNANNIRLLRYAEVLLTYAEAAERTGDNGAAVATLNELRTVRGLAPKASVTLEDIWTERRLELAGENDRYHELVRTGKAATELAEFGWTEAHKYWPVPQAEIDRTTGEIEQNPGYSVISE